MLPLISIIVPIYNKENIISKTIESLIAQNYGNIEILLVNDGSKDKSLEICSAWAKKDGRIKVLDKENGGVSSARNAGLKAASGEYIGFVDGDDTVLPDMYKILFENISKYKADISVCGFICGAKNISGKAGLFTSKDFIRDNIKHLSVWNKLFKKQIIKGLLFEESLSYAEDFLFCFQALMHAKKVFVDDGNFYIYNVTQESATRQVFSSKQLASFKVFKILLADKTIKQDVFLSKMLQMYKIYGMVGFLKSFIDKGYEKPYLNRFFVKNIRKHIFAYMFSGYPLFNRLFALSACINFALTKKVYKFIFNI